MPDSKRNIQYFVELLTPSTVALILSPFLAAAYLIDKFDGAFDGPEKAAFYLSILSYALSLCVFLIVCGTAIWICAPIIRWVDASVADGFWLRARAVVVRLIVMAIFFLFATLGLEPDSKLYVT